ncbi:plasmid mobilization relaxosome protein MobC, partial (plasmid) [Enterobacter hormaechei]
MLTMWVTEDEHRRLLERCDGRSAASTLPAACRR